MSNNKTPSMGNFNNNACFNPAPTNKQLRKKVKSHINQCQTILKVLKRNEYINSDQLRDMGVDSGSKRINELKKSGFMIEKSQSWEKKAPIIYRYVGHISECHG